MASSTTVYDKPGALLAALGSWWAEEYAGRGQVLDIIEAKALVEEQTSQDLLELLDAMSRHTVPIYHKDNWYSLRLLESTRNTAEVSPKRYDTGLKHDEGHKYDQSTLKGFAFPKPANLVSAPLVMNRFTDPSVLWTAGLDTWLTETGIVFKTDPFADSRIVKRPVYANGQIVDQEVQLWIYSGEWDWETAYQQYGYVLQTRMESSPGYRDLLNGVFDAIIGGPSGNNILRAMSAITGVPLVREAEEEVEQLVQADNRMMVITDQHVYRFAPTAEPIVEIGQTVIRGESLSDSLEVIELNRGQLPDTVKALSIGNGILLTCFYDGLIFENRELPLSVNSTHTSGYTKVTFPLGGFPADVERFFDIVHERGIAAAEQSVDDCDPGQLVRYPANDCDETEKFVRVGTLAHLLDRRSVRVGEPTAAHLPTTINPLKFLVEHLLRYHAVLVRVKAAHGEDPVGLQHMRLLQRVIPPHTVVLMIVEMTGMKDSVTVDDITESTELFYAMETQSENTPMPTDTRHSVWRVTGTCQ